MSRRAYYQSDWTEDQFTDNFSRILDEANNERAIANLENPDASIFTLQELLSIDHAESNMSSVAQHHQSIRTVDVGFRKIGFGQCGLIFEQPGRGQVLKVARKWFEDALWSDLVCHSRVYEALEKHPSNRCCTPRIYKYLAKDNDWWKSTGLEMLGKSKTPDFPLPSPTLVTQRILPLPKVAREALIKEFCPEHLQQSVTNNQVNRDCLIRVYLGKRRSHNAPPSANFTLRNFNLHLDQMELLDLPIYEYGAAIATALATIHWEAHVDGFDIEFILGSEGAIALPITNLAASSTGRTLSQGSAILSEVQSDIQSDIQSRVSAKDIETMPSQTNIDKIMELDFTRRTTRLWVLDFNLCSTWDQKTMDASMWINQLVFSFFENDPYYPLPLMVEESEKRLWDVFVKAYLKQGDMIVHGTTQEKLPMRFIEACIDREKKMFAQFQKHGHREEKG